MTNIDRIAELRGTGPAAAVEFWQQVCKIAKIDLSTHDVLKLLLAHGERVSAISAGELAATVPLVEVSDDSVHTAPLSSQKSGISEPNNVGSASVEPVARSVPQSTPISTAADDIAFLADSYDLSIIEAEELYQLLVDMLPLGFTRSKQLSQYIIDHQLGYRYPNISGIVTMENGVRQWELAGGFPRWIYAIICEELGLGNEGSTARPVGFVSFDAMEENDRPFDFF
jgi:hypothetical protein